MIKRLKKRYLITNMALLSGTLLVSLGILFGILYHAEVSASYTIMEEMMKPARAQKPPPKETVRPTGYTYSGDVQLDLLSDYRDESADGIPTVQLAEDQQQEENPPMYWPSWPYPWPPYVPPPWWWNPGDGSDNGQQNPGGDPNQNPDGGENRGDHGPDAGTEPPQTQPPQTEPPQKHFHDPQQKETQPPAQTQPPQIEQQPPQPIQEYIEPPAETDPPQTTTTVTTTSQTTETTKTTATTTQTTAQTENATKAPAEAEQKNGVQAEQPQPPAAEPEPPHDSGPQAGEPPIVPVEEGQFVPDVFIAEIDENGNIETYAGNDPRATDNEHFDTIHKAIKEVRRRGRSSGILRINDKPYRFIYRPDDAGHYRLVLLDRTLERSTIHRLIFIFAMIGLIGLGITFLISWKLANWTVTPIASAWEKQKQFVADASHELKTPLAVIAANTEVIMSNPQESVSGQSKWLSYIQAETMRMSKLITNLLSVARMDSGKQKKAPADPLSLSDAVSNVCLVFEPIVYENGKKLTSSVQNQVLVDTDEDNIKQLLSILLDNAVLHSVPQATISVSLTQEPHGKIMLSVANTAKDIPQEQLVHLFDRFYRVDTEGSPNGSGLGLSIAKSIVRQMGGDVSVTSENSLFTFTAELPAA